MLVSCLSPPPKTLGTLDKGKKRCNPGLLYELQLNDVSTFPDLCGRGSTATAVTLPHFFLSFQTTQRH